MSNKKVVTTGNGGTHCHLLSHLGKYRHVLTYEFNHYHSKVLRVLWKSVYSQNTIHKIRFNQLQNHNKIDELDQFLLRLNDLAIFLNEKSVR